MLVSPTDLKKVEEIGGGGVDGNEVLGGSRSWGWEAGDGEFVGALERLVDGMEEWRNGVESFTLRYPFTWIARIMSVLGRMERKLVRQLMPSRTLGLGQWPQRLCRQ